MNDWFLISKLVYTTRSCTFPHRPEVELGVLTVVGSRSCSIDVRCCCLFGNRMLGGSCVIEMVMVEVFHYSKVSREFPPNVSIPPTPPPQNQSRPRKNAPPTEAASRTFPAPAVSTLGGVLFGYLFQEKGVQGCFLSRV
jgi:hypothetical protein